jgi:hypothetical protein
MKFGADERQSGAMSAEARAAGPPGSRPLPWSRTAQTGKPAWLLEVQSLLCMAGGLGILFVLWRAAAYLIRAASGGSQ